MRNILGVNRFTSLTILNETLEFMTVKQIISYPTLRFIYKMINGRVSGYLTNRIKYQNNTHNRDLRNANQVDVVSATKTCSQNSLFYRGIKLFNDLPKEIREEIIPNKFQLKLKTYIRGNIRK